jgi:excisionase family DNA binding protein
LPSVLTVKEVASALKCGLSTVYEMCDSGVLKCFRLKPGSQKGIRVFADSVEALMRGGPAQPAVVLQPAPSPLPAKRRPCHQPVTPKGLAFLPSHPLPPLSGS